MASSTLKSEIVLRRPIEEVFDFFSRAENLNLLTPPWLHFNILTPLPLEMEAGTRIAYRLRIRGVPVGWVSEITQWEPPHQFTDAQIKGPYRSWVHRHYFQATDDGGVRVTDDVRYSVPGGWLVNRLFVAGELRRIFSYRREQLLRLFP